MLLSEWSLHLFHTFYELLHTPDEDPPANPCRLQLHMAYHPRRLSGDWTSLFYLLSVPDSFQNHLKVHSHLHLKISGFQILLPAYSSPTQTPYRRLFLHPALRSSSAHPAAAFGMPAHIRLWAYLYLIHLLPAASFSSWKRHPLLHIETLIQSA